ncbi:MAG: hypothetical protein RLZZ358_1084 [Bacteroidota bacterium]|jgi:hypothetical protein
MLNYTKKKGLKLSESVLEKEIKSPFVPFIPYFYNHIRLLYR